MIAKEIEVIIPFIRKLSIEEIGPEPWKYETPIYGVGNELITIICEKGIYFMTDEADALKMNWKTIIYYHQLLINIDQIQV